MNKNSISVIMARFEVAVLTPEHHKMLDEILAENYAENHIVLGVACTKCTKANPLDFEARRLMINQAYPNKFIIHYIKDMALDEKWSADFDKLIESFRNNHQVEIYSSKDRFYDHYVGQFKDHFHECKQEVFMSDMQQRKLLATQVKGTADWRAGVVFATQNRYPTMFSTVDVAIFDDSTLQTIYLARKPNETLLRFVGGFLDPTDDSVENAVERETLEETGMKINFVGSGYVCSQKVDDWRYRNEEDKIMTHLYAVTKADGRAQASDDIADIRLKQISELTEDDFVPEHRTLFRKLLEWRTKHLMMIQMLSAH